MTLKSIIIALIALSILSASAAAKLTSKQLNALEVGMPIEKVMDILGLPDYVQLSSENKKYMDDWTTFASQSVGLYYENGRYKKGKMRCRQIIVQFDHDLRLWAVNSGNKDFDFFLRDCHPVPENFTPPIGMSCKANPERRFCKH